MNFFHFKLSLVLALLLSACSGNNNNSADLNSNATGNSNSTTASILTAPLEDKRAMIVAVNQVMANSSQIGGGSPGATLNFKNKKKSFSLISTAYAEPLLPVCPTHPEGIACPEGGCVFFEDPPGDAGTITPGPEGSGTINLNNFSAQIRTEQCKGRPLESCRFPYSTTGTAVSTLNGTMTFPSMGGEPTFNITGRASTSGECSGMTIDTSNDFGRPRNMGFRTHAVITGIGSSAIRNAQITGEVCIDNIHYLIPSREQLNQLLRELCGS